MEHSVELLGNIYVLLTILCFTYVISTIIRGIAYISRKRIESIKTIKDELNRELEDLFNRNMLPELKAIADRILLKEPNNTIAIYWVMRMYYRENEWTNVNITADRLIHIDPTFKAVVSNFAKP